MSTLTATLLLALWEQGSLVSPTERAVLLLAAADPTAQSEQIAGWSLGRRDAAILDVRALLFGERIESLTFCPRCGAASEISFTTSAVRAPYAETELPPLDIGHTGHSYLVRLRPISSNALLAVAHEARPEALVLQCIVSVQRDGVELSPAELPPDLLARCAETLAGADPQADIRLSLVCAECGERWNAPFDPAGFLWREIEQWAERILREIHVLASAYGWSETEILALSATRRRRYIEMVMG